MRKYLIALTFLSGSVFSTAALAHDWTGLYIGAHAGYGWGDWEGKLETSGNPPTKDAGYADPFRSIDGDGWLGGIQAGYNWQLPSRIVVGFEADISWGDLEGSETFDTDKYDPWIWSKKHDLSLDRFGTVRGRIGYAMGSALPYVTGGVAWGKVSGDLAVAQSHDGAQAVIDGVSYASTSENHVGWTAGVGIEYALSENLSFKAEYLHLDLGTEAYLFKGECWCGIPFNTDSFKSDLTFDVVRVGLNYRFGERETAVSLK